MLLCKLNVTPFAQAHDVLCVRVFFTKTGRGQCLRNIEMLLNEFFARTSSAAGKFMTLSLILLLVT